jgi:hypothetical protein
VLIDYVIALDKGDRHTVGTAFVHITLDGLFDFSFSELLRAKRDRGQNECQQAPRQPDKIEYSPFHNENSELMQFTIYFLNLAILKQRIL